MRTAKLCGWDLMPWQAEWLDVVGEYDPATGIPFYREAFYTVPRQSGKTAVGLSWALDRCLSWGVPQIVAWTAQSAKEARDKWLDELYPRMQHHPVKAAVSRLNRGFGNETINLRTGSVIRLVATGEESGHGKTVNAAFLDEIFADKDMRRQQSLIPAMNTVRDAQTLVTSTAGTNTSTVYNTKQRAGRAAVEADAGEGIAYLEYSAPDGWDPSDEGSWWRFMPALGHTITPQVVRHALQTMTADPELGLAEFMRAYGNVPTAGADMLIPDDVWERVCDPEAAPDAGLVFAVAVATDRGSAAVAVADNRGVVELIEHRRGTSWVAGVAEKLGGVWVLDGGGPAAPLVDDLPGARKMGGREVIDACGAMFNAVVECVGVVVRPHDSLTAAVRGVAKRPVGDAWVWSRKGSSEDVTPLEAATLAWWAARRPSTPGGFYSFD